MMVDGGSFFKTKSLFQIIYILYTTNIIAVAVVGSVPCTSTVPTNQVLVLTALTGGTYIPTVRSEISKTNSKYSTALKKQ